MPKRDGDHCRPSGSPPERIVFTRGSGTYTTPKRSDLFRSSPLRRWQRLVIEGESDFAFRAFRSGTSRLAALPASRSGVWSTGPNFLPKLPDISVLLATSAYHASVLHHDLSRRLQAEISSPQAGQGKRKPRFGTISRVPLFERLLLCGRSNAKILNQ